MNIFNLFHRRKEETEGFLSSIYTYKLTLEARKRLVMYIQNAVEEMHKRGLFDSLSVVEDIVRELRMAFGVFKLDEISNEIITSNMLAELLNFIYSSRETDKVLSAIELLCKEFSYKSGFIESINEIFRYSRIGYKYFNDKILKVDDETFTDECLNKSLGILSEEYAQSHELLVVSYEKLSNGEFEEAIINSCKAIESLLKYRLDKLKIPYDKDKDTYAKLLDIANTHITCSVNFEYIKQLLLNVSRARNTKGAHGPDPNYIPPTEEFCRFIINQASANLLFLAEIEMK